MAQVRKTSPKKVIFNASDVAQRLNSLMNEAVESGKGEEFPWWEPALGFEWGNFRKGNNGTQWANVCYTDEKGITGRLVVRINGERHSGQIMPSNDAGVSELAARTKNPNVKIEKRTKKPVFQIQKWSVKVKTADDEISVLADADGQPMIPGDEFLSPYYKVARLVGEAFVAEAKLRVDRGNALLTKATEMKRADKQVTAKAVMDAFAVSNGPGTPGYIVISSEGMAGIRKLFPAAKDSDVIMKGAISVSSSKIVNLVQEYVGLTAKKNVGLPLPNPMTRIAMNFDAVTGLAQLAFFDKGAPYIAEGKQRYEVGKVDGDPVNADNVHKFIVSRCTADGIINMDSVCCSSFGISMPVKVDVLVVEKPEFREIGIDDVYDDDGCVLAGSAAPDLEGAEGNAPGSRTASPTATPPVPEENYNDLIAELSNLGK